MEGDMDTGKWDRSTSEWTRPDGILVMSDFKERFVPLMVTWAPKEDITTYELARALPYLLAPTALTRSTFDAMPESAQRHFNVRSISIIEEEGS